MNEDIKQRWVAALRSGDYEQAGGLLRVKKQGGKFGYCCLGVLCDLAAKEDIGEWRGNDLFVGTSDNFDTSSTVLPPSVQEWAGITDSNPYFDLPEELESFMDDSFVYEECSLASVNDHGLNFEQIADIIETTL